MPKRPPRKTYIITAEDWGVYLGNSMGVMFWTLLDPAGLPAAPTFTSASAAHNHVREWIDMPKAYTVHAVEAGSYIPLWELKKQGFGDLLGEALYQFVLHTQVSGRA